MARKVKIELNKDAIRDLLRSADVEHELMDRGEAIARAAGDGHVVDSFQGHDRVHVVVRTETHEAKLAEAEDRNLTRSIDAARY